MKAALEETTREEGLGGGTVTLYMTGARARRSGVRYWLRLDMASPSASRLVSTTITCPTHTNKQTKLFERAGPTFKRYGAQASEHRAGPCNKAHLAAPALGRALSCERPNDTLHFKSSVLALDTGCGKTLDGIPVI